MSATLGSVTGGDITGSTFHNATNTFSIDGEGNIKGANITGSSLHLTTTDFTTAGVHVGNINFFAGDIGNGETIPIPSGYTEDECFFLVTATAGGGNPGTSNPTEVINFWGYLSGRVAHFKTVYKITSSDNTTAEVTVDGGSGRYSVLAVKKI